jgi:hypothetical protein
MKTIEEIDRALLLKAQELIRDRYSYNDLGHPAVQKIFNICAVIKAGEIAENDGESGSISDEYLEIDSDE